MSWRLASTGDAVNHSGLPLGAMSETGRGQEGVASIFVVNGGTGISKSLGRCVSLYGEHPPSLGSSQHTNLLSESHVNRVRQAVPILPLFQMRVDIATPQV